eukprot:13994140-Alexandrium_andersonii.AAC.1
MDTLRRVELADPAGRPLPELSGVLSHALGARCGPLWDLLDNAVLWRWPVLIERLLRCRANGTLSKLTDDLLSDKVPDEPQARRAHELRRD